MGLDIRTKKEYRIVCMAENCGRKAPWAKSASNAHKKARQHGWKVRKKRWVCQRCLTAARHGRKAL